MVVVGIAFWAFMGINSDKWYKTKYKRYFELKKNISDDFKFQWIHGVIFLPIYSYWLLLLCDLNHTNVKVTEILWEKRKA